ncbi:MAG: hypothetical protein IT558_06355 [Alphaproteobacteria bacterium]|nr:hypothetical protein [Alphaproteobacteria bacterium]
MDDWSTLQWFEFLSYAATVVGIPMALWAFLHEERKERLAEQEEIYDKLMDHYDDILARLFEHPELDQHEKPMEDPESRRQQKILYEMLVTLFERAFILLYGEKETEYLRMWNSWEDYIKLWTNRPNFREALPELMLGEDIDFVSYMSRLSGLKLAATQIAP